MATDQVSRAERKHLSPDALLRAIRQCFEEVPHPRPAGAKVSTADSLMAGFALFALKEPSLLAFDDRRRDDAKNLEMIFHIKHVPCDTQLREILDPVDPEAVRPAFLEIFRRLQRGKVLEQFTFIDGHYLLSLDGTGYFSSGKVRCASCMQKTSRNGKITYYHQMLGAVIVHPDIKEVIPVMPEPIIKQDGQAKNDCERNAAKRFFQKFRQDHPHLPVIVVEDGLASNAPHILECRRHNLRFILGAKKGDHSHLFKQVKQRREQGAVEEFEILDEPTGICHRFLLACDVPLNESNQDLLVNFIEYWELRPNGYVQHFSWVTDLPLCRDTAMQIMRGGRARWKIENETFNTLKNQGYHFEHNFGHGNENLSVVFAMLMMLAFLVDQTNQLTSPLFQQAWKKAGSKRRLWELVRNVFRSFTITSMSEIYASLAYGLERGPPKIKNPPSR